MASLTITPKHHIESMERLAGSIGKRIVLETVGPEGRVGITTVLKAVIPFQAIWVSEGSGIKGVDFIGRRTAIRSIIPIHDTDTEKSKLYDNEANLPEELVYGTKSRAEVYELRKESFGERIADALEQPQLGDNPLVLRVKYLGEHLRDQES
jgi:hypothetical protein